MVKRMLYCSIALLAIGVLAAGYSWFSERRVRAQAAEATWAFLVEERSQENALLDLGEVDLNPSYLTLALMEQRLHGPTLSKPGDFNSTRLGWACGKARCAIWASVLVPFGQEIPPSTTPAGLILTNPSFGDLSNIKVGEVHLGGSDEKLVKSSGMAGLASDKPFRRTSWDQNWDVAWESLNGEVDELVFSNQNLQRQLSGEQGLTAPKLKK